MGQYHKKKKIALFRYEEKNQLTVKDHRDIVLKDNMQMICKKSLS